MYTVWAEGLRLKVAGGREVICVYRSSSTERRIAPLWTPFSLTCLWITFSTYNTKLHTGPLRRQRQQKQEHMQQNFSSSVETSPFAHMSAWRPVTWTCRKLSALSHSDTFPAPPRTFTWEIMNLLWDNGPFVYFITCSQSNAKPSFYLRSRLVGLSYWHMVANRRDWVSISSVMDLQVVVWLFYCFLLPTVLLAGKPLSTDLWGLRFFWGGDNVWGYRTLDTQTRRVQVRERAGWQRRDCLRGNKVKKKKKHTKTQGQLLQ